jgi:hypothetical protein
MTRGGFSNHLRYCKLNPNSDLNKKQLSLKQKEYLEKHKQIKNEYILYCTECGKEYKLFLTEKQYNNGKYSKFCSIFCARKHASNCTSDNLKEAKCIDCGKLIYIKNRASDKTCRCNDCKLIHNEPLKKCIVCGKEFRRHNAKCCSKECSYEYRHNLKKYLSEESIEKLRKTGKKSAAIQAEYRRSKNEIEFCKLCESYFNNVEHNKPIFNGWDADVIIHDIKYAVLWNGKCHYEPIFGVSNLNRTINRDKIKIEEIKKCNYIPYIIKDMGSYNLEFVKEKFNEFINYLKENNYY